MSSSQLTNTMMNELHATIWMNVPEALRCHLTVEVLRKRGFAGPWAPNVPREACVVATDTGYAARGSLEPTFKARIFRPNAAGAYNWPAIVKAASLRAEVVAARAEWFAERKAIADAKQAMYDTVQTLQAVGFLQAGQEEV